VSAAPPLRRIERAAENQTRFVELESVDCLHCGGRDHETIIVAGDHLTGIGGHFRVVRCRSCQLAFTNPRPTARSIGHFYPESYVCYAERESPRRTALQRPFLRALLRTNYGYPPQPTRWADTTMAAIGQAFFRGMRRRASWIPYRMPGRLLEFGCGAGHFMKQMREYGWTVEGVDVSREMAERLHSEGLRVHVGTLPHSDLRPASFDAVTMRHSLEHVHSPREVLRAAWDVLRKGGLLAVAVPNLASWSFRHFQHDWQPLELPRHLTHFTPQTLSMMVESERFRILSIEQISKAKTLRKSAERATKSRSSWRRRVLRFGAINHPMALWLQRTGQADGFQLIAEKP
jgi:2-polyprenyl-3-methyl-5-hydroxy-6-metoxy-1,4-benzoquinol methylase